MNEKKFVAETKKEEKAVSVSDVEKFFNKAIEKKIPVKTTGTERKLVEAVEVTVLEELLKEFV